MTVFIETATQMAILFLLIAAGIIARKANLMNDDFDSKLSKLILDVAFPAMVIGSVLNNSDLPDVGTILRILLISTLAMLLVIAISELVTRLYRKSTRSEQETHAFAMAFGNVGFMGFPVMSALFGSDAVLYAAIFNVPFNFLVFTYGIAMLKRGARDSGKDADAEEAGWREKVKSTAKSLCNPTMISCIAAPILAGFGITDEGGIIGTFCETLGNFVVPGSMLIIGSNLATMSVKDMLSHGNVYATSLMRLLVIPITVYLVFRNFVTDPMLLGILVIATGMPTASLGTMLSLIYGGDIKTIMRCTFMTTVLSLVTIPIIATIAMA